jgi:2'-5' RNA ligase
MKYNLIQDVCEYLLVLSPNRNISNQILQIKHEFKRRGCLLAANLHPHITLANFVLPSAKAEHICICLKKFASLRRRLLIELNGFNHFRTHTIFLDVKYKAAIIQLVVELKKVHGKQMKAYCKSKPYFCRYPHLTIARGLRADQYIALYSQYEDKSFNALFEDNELVLLRRNLFGSRLYKPVKYFSLSGLGNFGEQTDLFHQTEKSGSPALCKIY